MALGTGTECDEGIFFIPSLSHRINYVDNGSNASNASNLSVTNPKYGFKRGLHKRDF